MDREIRRRLNYGLPVPKRIQTEHAQEDADKNAKDSRNPENETRAHANMLRVFRAGGHTSVYVGKKRTPLARWSKMAVRAERWIPLLHCLRVEVWPVRIDAASERRVALHAVGLLVTAGASGHAATRRLPVLEQPERLARVCRSRSSVRSRADPRNLTMARTAEHLGVVTGCALRLSRVRLGRVTGNKIERVEAPLSRPLVAARAKTLLMTARAVQPAGGGNRPVGESEVGRVDAHDAPGQGIGCRGERQRWW